MASHKGTLVGATLLSMVVVAVSMGIGKAEADVCFNCPPVPGPGSALSKHIELGFPGNTEGVFDTKVETLNAFSKHNGLGFPGNTEDVFGEFDWKY